MIDAILQQVARIPFHIVWRSSHVHFGQHQSRLRGSGMEFDQLKEYQEGESVRTINWAATARRGGSPLLVNTYYEEKDITVMLLVDLSASMDFGSTRIHKRTLAAEVSASLAYSALAARDRVGFVGFTAQIEYYYPPSRSKAYQRAIPEAILSGGASRTSASFWVAVEALEQRIKTPALVFLLSDFLTDDLPQITQALSKLRFRHDLIALVITDPREQSLPTGNIRIPVRDLETGEVHMYCFSAKNRRAMVEQAEKRQQQLRQMFQDRDIAHVCITPQSDYIADITQLFWTRHRRGFQ